MKLPKIVDTDLTPVYCWKCQGQDTFDREPEQDIIADDGKVLWRRWRCRQCGYGIIRPGKES